MNKSYSKTEELVGMGIMIALVIVLQTFASGVKIGTFTLPLSLIPIIVGSIFFGPVSGLILGFTFGAVVLFAVLSGAEPFSTILLNQNPVMTILLIFGKGMAAGFMSGLFYKVFKKKSEYLGVLMAAMIAPVMNTGIFTLGMLTVFYNVLSDTAAKAGVSNPTFFALTAFLGIRFLMTIGTLLILIPVFYRITVVTRRIMLPKKKRGGSF